MMKGEGGRGSWLRRDKSVASPLGGALGLMVVWLLRRRGAPGCARILLGRYFVPGWELRRPCLGIWGLLGGDLGVARWLDG